MTIYSDLSYDERVSIEDGLNNTLSIYLDYFFDCEKLKKKPYVCNDCPSRSACIKHRYTYYARETQKSYEKLIKSSREGIDLTEEKDYFKLF